MQSRNQGFAVTLCENQDAHVPIPTCESWIVRRESWLPPFHPGSSPGARTTPTPGTPDSASQAVSLAAILATRSPWYFAASNSIEEGWRDPSPSALVEAP